MEHVAAWEAGPGYSCPGDTGEHVRVFVHVSSDTDVGRRGRGSASGRISSRPCCSYLCSPSPSCWVWRQLWGSPGRQVLNTLQGRARGADPTTEGAKWVPQGAQRGKGRGQLDAGPHRSLLLLFTSEEPSPSQPHHPTAFSRLGALGPVLATLQAAPEGLAHPQHPPGSPQHLLTLVPTVPGHACSWSAGRLLRGCAPCLVF